MTRRQRRLAGAARLEMKGSPYSGGPFVILGFYLAGMLGIAPENAILRFVVALIGASLLIFILRALGVFGKK